MHHSSSDDPRSVIWIQRDPVDRLVVNDLSAGEHDLHLGLDTKSHLHPLNDCWGYRQAFIQLVIPPALRATSHRV